jgi:RND family efflux transporter MFP subunit
MAEKRKKAVGAERWLLAVAVLLAGAAALVAYQAGWLATSTAPAAAPSAPAPQPALTVRVVRPQSQEWSKSIEAYGNVAPWQEAVIGAEISNYRLADVLVNVGDRVRRGDLLAQVASESVAAELALSHALVSEAAAALAEARGNAERARQLQPSGAITSQQICQYLAAEQMASARVAAASARVQMDLLRMVQTRIVAPDDGVISARAASVGSLVQPGQELFRLIRGGRLEWRAEVTAAELARLSPGLPVVITTPQGGQVTGRVRMVGPTVDPQTRYGVVYVDLAPASEAEGGTLLRAGMFVRGDFDLGRAPVLTLPQSAVLLRDGFAYVFCLEKGERVAQVKVGIGRRSQAMLEIVSGLAADTPVVAAGVGFLTDGDLVRCVDTPLTTNAAAAKVD